MLELRGVNAFYGASRILRNVSLRVPPGKLVALLGRNGAGKSTLLKTIVGQAAAQSGRVRFGGGDITAAQPWRIARAGIAYVPEARGIFPSLTVAENLFLARRGGEWNEEKVFALFPPLKKRLRHGGGELSGGEQQMLAIARALLQNPRLLLLDEPTEGLAPVVVDEIRRCLAGLKTAGPAILLVEQNHSFAAALADQIYVLGKGEIRWHGAPAELRADVVGAWLGVHDV
ncbi:MAG: ABC transporter ATP-binding protein [Gammaproteobacteria bacterium]|nr:ABC transporter ATP-binding protein [Gammaproteobacteria bacterium]